MLRETIEQLIRNYVSEYGKNDSLKTSWKEPLVAFADARDPRVLALKTVVHPEHFMPEDILPSARTIVSYFVPFDARIEKSNIGGGESSSEWNYAYVETNVLFEKLNHDVTAALTRMGCRAAFAPQSVIFDRDTLKGRWSHRHLAVIAGLGTFGINNLLITKQGCCGRTNSFLISEPIDPGSQSDLQPVTDMEYCLYKRNGSCRLCVDRCPPGALTLSGFDRCACDKQLQKNRRTFPGIGTVETCGKCVVGLPCSDRIPR